MSTGDQNKSTQEISEDHSNKSVSVPVRKLHLKRLDKYASLPNLFGRGQIRKNQWEDNQMLGLKYVEISGFSSLDQSLKADILKTGLSSLTEQVSEYSVGALLEGAWGLISCENFNRPCFIKFPNMLSEGVNLNKLETQVSKQGYQTGEIKYTGTNLRSWNHYERSATYMCAAILRLVVKSEANLMNAWEYLMNRYRFFYNEDIAFRISLSRDCVVAVRSSLQNRKVLKETVAVFLLAFQELNEGKDKEMCEMLYELQIRHTGMHAYNLLLICSTKLGAPISELIELLKHREANDALETATELLKTYKFPEDEEAKARANKAKTWRYARVFDSDVFASLGTKNCTKLTALLACLAQKLGSESSGDFTKIRGIEGYVETNKDLLEKVAQNVIRHGKSAGWGDPHKVTDPDAAASSSGHSGQSG